MGVLELEQGLKLIENRSGGFFKGAISGDFIASAEKFLGVSFPDSYKKFLSLKGCGSFKSKEFYGIVGEDFLKGSVPNGIWLTGDERNSSNLDHNLVLIAQSIEGYYALDTARMQNGECPVVDAIPIGKREAFEVIASDFGTFFLEQIREVL
jgi:antitoxin YobK